MPASNLLISIDAAPNFIVDSNLKSGPTAAYLAAHVTNAGPDTLTDVTLYMGDQANNTPGVYPVVTNPPGFTGSLSLKQEGGTADATRFLGTLAPGQTVTQYWLVSYPWYDAAGKQAFGAHADNSDDLVLPYDVWAKGSDAGTPVSAAVSKTATMREEISAMANKIWPNTTSKVPDQFLTAFQDQLGWRPDQVAPSVARTEGIWYDFGRVNQGFDADANLVPDYDVWSQPVGDPATFDPRAWRLVHSYGVLIVKLNDGTDKVIAFEDQLYHKDLPANNTGVVGLVFYEFAPIGVGAGQLSPYQEAASGSNNEKFNGDFGTPVGGATGGPPSVVFTKTVDNANVSPGGTLTYTLTATDTDATWAFGLNNYGTPAVISDAIPAGTQYVGGSAAVVSGVAAQVHYSTDGGVTWTTAQPANPALVTNLQWWLSAPLSPSQSEAVSFQTTVPVGYSQAQVVNTGGVGLGRGLPIAPGSASSFVLGSRQISGSVFRDDGAGGGTAGDGAQNGTEGPLSNVDVTLYLDANGNGVIDAGDTVRATTTSAANGGFSFTNLPSGKYVVRVRRGDPDLPTGYQLSTVETYAADVTSGNRTGLLFGFSPSVAVVKSVVGSGTVNAGEPVSYTLSTTDLLKPVGYVPPSTATNVFWTDGGATDTFKDVPTGGGGTNTVTLSAGTVSPLDLAFDMTAGKVYEVYGSGTVTVSNLDGTSRQVLVNITTGNGTVGGIAVDTVNGYVYWTNNSSGGSASTAGLYRANLDGSNVLHLTVGNGAGQIPNNPQSVALDPVDGHVFWDELAAGNLTVRKADVNLSSGSITTVIDKATNGIGGPNGNSNLIDLEVDPAHRTIYFTDQKSGNNEYIGLVDYNDNNTGATYQVLTGTTLNGKKPAGLALDVANGLIYWEQTSGTTGIFKATVNFASPAGFSGSLFVSPAVTSLKALEAPGPLVVTSPGVFDAHNTLTTVTLRDTFDASKLRFVSASVMPDVVNNATGTLTWNNVGAINPAATKTITVNFVAVAAGASVANTATVTNAAFADGTAGIDVNNPPSDTKTITINAATGNVVYGTVWHDHANFGTRDFPTEAGIAGVTVQLRDSGDAATVAATTTDAYGNYRFAGFANGSYRVRVVPPAGYAETSETFPAGTPNDATLDNLISSGGAFSVSGSAVMGSYDFGYKQTLTGTGSIGDQVFYDWNGNNVKDAGDEGIPNAQVLLYQDINSNGKLDPTIDPLVAFTATDVNGVYAFGSLSAGNYLVRVNEGGAGFPAGLTASALNINPRAVTLTAGQVRTDVDFGYQPTYAGGSLGGTVWKDLNGDQLQLGLSEPGLPNVTVNLLADLNNDGVYVQVATTSTNASGQYAFSNLPLGKYRIVVDQTDADLPKDPYGFRYAVTTPGSFDRTLTTATPAGTANFGFGARGTVGDFVFFDANANGTQDWNEAGIPNVTLRLLDSNNNVVATTTTSAGGVGAPPVGFYLFTGVPSGTYTVAVDTATLPAGVTGADNTADPDRDGVPSWDNTYPGLPVADNKDSGVGVAFGTNYAGADFGYQPKGVVGDFVWRDTNSNGIQDPGEPGLANVAVSITNGTTTLTTHTDFDGLYTFQGLTQGTWTITVAQPAGMTPSSSGNVNDLLNGVGSVGANSATVTIDAGGNVTAVNGTPISNGALKIDFGYRQAGPDSIAGAVVLERQGSINGKAGDATDTPVAGETVFLYDGGNTLLGQTLTDAGGHYSFTNLPAGTYKVSMAATSPMLALTTLTTDNFPGSTPASSVTDNGTSAFQVVSVNGAVTGLDFAWLSTVSYDFGDLPDSYGTSLAADGARHIIAPENRTGTVTFTSGSATVTGTGTLFTSELAVGDQLFLQTSPGTPLGTVASITDNTHLTLQLAATASAVGSYGRVSLYLGTVAPDAEANGAPSAAATSDNLSGANDEDGVTVLNPTGWTAGTSVGNNVRVTVHGSGWLMAWFDFNQDGTFLNPNELVINQAVDSTGSPYTFAINVPAGALPGGGANVYARFRLFETPPVVPQVAFQGVATGGEVEDYLFTLGTPPQADLSLTKGVNNNSPRVGSNVVYTLTVSNAGPSAATGVSVQDLLPTGLQYVSDDGAGSYNGNTGIWTVGNVANGGSATLHVTARVLPSGGYGNYAQVLAANEADPDSTPGDNSGRGQGGDPASQDDNATVTLTPVPVADLSLSKSVNNATPNVGSNVVFTITVSNAGPSGATGVSVKDLLPAGLTYVSDDGGGTYASGSGTWSVGNVASGGSATLHVTATVTNAAVGGVTNTAEVIASDQFDPDSTPNNHNSAEDDQASATVTGQPIGSVGDRVWYDVDADGVQDAGEPGIVGAAVTLTWYGPNDLPGGGDDQTFSTTTGTDGAWSIGGLPAGKFSVAVTNQPNGFDTQVSGPTTFTLAASETRTDIDLGLRAIGSVGDFVWEDRNGNGVQDAGEPGLGNVTVKLTWAGQDGDLSTPADNVTYTTSTDGSGAYGFGQLPSGTFQVQFVAPTGYAFTAANAGGDDAKDSDANPSDGKTAVFTLPVAGDNATVDAGLFQPVTAGGTVWYDVNGNGGLDAGEPRLANVDVTLTWAGPDGVPGNGDDVSFGTQTTDVNGHYAFSGLPPGAYSVSVDSADLPFGLTSPTADPDGTGSPHTAAFTLTSGSGRSDLDFGYRGTGALGDHVWIDVNGDGVQDAAKEPGLPGVQVRLTWAGLDGNLGTPDDLVIGTATTDAAGGYGFANLPSGDFRADVLTGSLPGNVTETSDLDGVATANSSVRTLAVGEAATDVDFGYRGSASVSGTVWYDVDGDGTQNHAEPGIGGAVVTLSWAGPNGTLGDGDDVTFTTTTDADGHYGFVGLPVFGSSDPYRVTVTPPPAYTNQTFDADGLATPNQSALALGASEANTNQDFGYRGPLTQGLAGTVWLDMNGNGRQDGGTEAGVDGVTVELYDANGVHLLASTQTSGGAYQFLGLLPGDYQVRFGTSDGTTTYTRTVQDSPVADDTVDSDADVATGWTGPVTVSSAAVNNDVDAGLYLPASAGDRVWYDINGNGVQDAGEPGLDGVKVILSDAGLDGVLGTADDQLAGFTQTTGGGAYQFSGLRPGTYRAGIDTSTLPGGLTSETFDLDGTATADRATFTLTSGQGRTDADFGYRGTGSLGGRVWLDADADGVQDANGLEPSLPGVVLTLVWGGPNNDQLGNGNDVIIGTATTDTADPNYLFSNLPSGHFRIDVTPATLPGNVTETYDIDGLGTPDSAARSLAVGENASGVDFGYRGTASVSGTVWYDVDGDGTQNHAEPGIGGASVTLTWGGPDGSLGTADDVTFITTADASGRYSFSALPVSGSSDPYRVTVTPPATYTDQTFDADGLATPNQSTLALGSAESNTAQDFGYRGPATQGIGNFVWLDANSNGRQDVGEAGIDGVTVELYDANAVHLLAVTTTSGGGLYQFLGLVPGDYRLHFGASDGTNAYTRTAQDSPLADDTTDSDANVTTGFTGAVTVAGSVNDTVDAGLYRLPTAGGLVWYDVDGDGSPDANEPGIPGATVTLTWYGLDGVAGGGDDQTFGTTTGTDGAWSITSLPPGNYGAMVSTLPNGLTVQTAGVPTFTLTSGTDRGDIDFGYQGPGQIGDRVWYDVNRDGSAAGEPGVRGVTVRLTWFGFDGVSGGGDDVTYTTTTDGQGQYSFTDLPLGAFRVAVDTATLPPGLVTTYDLDGGTAAPDGATAVTLTSAAPSEEGADFGYTGQSGLAGRVWLDFDGDGVQDPDEPGLGGVTVTATWAGPDGALGTADDVTVPTTTAGDGSYLFADLPGGPYRVTVTKGLPAGVSNTGDPDGTLDGTTQVTLGGRGAPPDANFGYRGDGGVSGFVYRDLNNDGLRQPGARPAEGGIAGVTLILTGTDVAGNSITRRTTTGRDGAYSFGGLLAGTYLIQEVQPGAFADGRDTAGSGGQLAGNDRVSVSLATGVTSSMNNFGELPYSAVSGVVFRDMNRNGVRDPGDRPIGGAMVVLTGTDLLGHRVVRRQVVGGNGAYRFTGLLPGNYSVQAFGPPTTRTHPVWKAVGRPQPFALRVSQALVENLVGGWRVVTTSPSKAYFIVGWRPNGG